MTILERVVYNSLEFIDFSGKLCYTWIWIQRAWYIAVNNKKNAKLEKELKNIVVDLDKFYFIEFKANSHDKVKIKLYNMDLREFSLLRVVLIHEVTNEKKVIPCKVVSKSILEFRIDDTLFGQLQNPYDMQRWKVALASLMKEELQVRVLKKRKIGKILTKRYNKIEKSYNIDIDLYTGKYKKNSSKLEFRDQIIEVTPFYSVNGFFALSTMSKLLHFYRKRAYGIREIYILEDGFRIYMNLPTYFFEIEKICVIPYGAREIEMESYIVDYEILRQQKSNMDIQIDIDLKATYYYAARWHAEIFFRYGEYLYRCPLVFAPKRFTEFHSNKKVFRSDPIEMEYKIERNRSFSFICRMDSCYEKSFILRYAQVIETGNRSSLDKLIEDKRLRVIGCINAELEKIGERHLKIQLLNETLSRCEEVAVFFLDRASLKMMKSNIENISKTKGELEILDPKVGNEKYILCLAVKRQEYYYVLRISTLGREERRKQK